jgi:hypothetical protein
MKLFLYLFLIFSAVELFPQTDSAEVDYDYFSVTLRDKSLVVWTDDGEKLFSQEFENPVFTTAALDSDNVDEYVVIDYTILDQKKDYTIYVYNTLDTFYCIDSIRSGFYEPSVYFSEEVKQNVIITGNPAFNEFNIGKEDISLPINVWSYYENGIVKINDQIYDLFQSENDNLTNYLDEFFNSNNKDCNTSLQVNNAIASGYVNYFSAGEIAVANQFLLKYYLCGDIDSFKKKLEKLL